MSHSDVKRNPGGKKERARRTRNENDGKSGKSRDRLKARETLGQEPGRENMQVQRMAETKRKRIELNCDQKGERQQVDFTL